MKWCCCRPAPLDGAEIYNVNGPGERGAGHGNPGAQTDGEKPALHGELSPMDKVIVRPARRSALPSRTRLQNGVYQSRGEIPSAFAMTR